MAIEVQVVSNSQSARQDLDKLSKSVDNIGKAVEKTSSQFQSFSRNLVTSVVSAASVLSLVKMSDTLTSLESKLRVSTEGLGSFNNALKETRQIALNTRNDLATVSTLYSKVAMSAKNMGATQKQVARVTESVSKALALSGATVAESQAAILQLGQALASGKLSGDELRSILENAPQLANAISKGLGVAMGDLRRLGEEGKLTSDLIFGAIIRQSGDIDKAFKNVGVTFGQAFTNIGNAGLVLFDALKNFGKLTAAEDAANAQSRTLAQVINDAALSLYRFADNFEIRVLQMRTSFWLFINDLAHGLANIPNYMAKAVGSTGFGMLEKIATMFDNLRRINLMTYMPTLSPALDLIKTWVYTAERAFFWLYDRVIGHSWIPDLVNGISNWISKLNGKPLQTARDFVKILETEFKTLTDKAMGVPFIDNLIKKISELKASVNDSKFMRNMRQAFGMKETVAGTYENRAVTGGVAAYDTNSFVGRGPRRNQADRGMLHDVVNTFKSENQIPFLAALTATIGAGLMVGVESGSFVKGLIASIITAFGTAAGGLANRLVPIGVLIGGGILSTLSSSTAVKVLGAVLTTAFGLAAGVYVSNKEVSLTTASVTKAFVDGVQGGVKVLFGSGLFGDRGFGGTLAMIAKLALLFKAGREELLKMAVGVATAPTKIADAAGDIFQKKAADIKASRADAQAAKLLAEHTSTLNKYSSDVRKELKTFQSLTNKDGALIPKSVARDLMKSIRKNDPMGFEAATKGLTTEARLSAERMRDAARGYQIAKDQTSKVNAAADKFKRSSDDLKQMSASLGARIAETKEATQRAFASTAGGVGGIFGALAGFNLGGRIAEQMVGYSDWAKIGVQISTAMIGQGIGAAIGQGIARVLIMSIGMLTSPITLAIAAGAAILYGAYKAWTEPGWLNAQYEKWYNLGNEWASMIWNGIMGRNPETVKNISSTKDELKSVLQQYADTKAEGKDTTELAKRIDELRQSLVQMTGNKAFGLYGIDKVLEGYMQRGWQIFEDAFRLRGGFISTANAAENVAKGNAADIVPITQANFDKLVAVIRSNEGSKSGDTSPMGAKGTMQITKDTFDTYKKVGESFDKEADRVTVALRKLWDDFTYFGGNIRQTAAAYHGGRGSIMASGEVNPQFAERFKDAKGNVTRIGTYTKDYASSAVKKFNAGAMDKVKESISDSKNFLEDLYKTVQSEGFAAAAKKLSNAFGDAAIETKTAFKMNVDGAKTLEQQLEVYNTALTKMGVQALTMAEFKNADPGDLDKIADLITNWQESQAAMVENVNKGWTAFSNRFEKLSVQSKNAAANIRKGIEAPNEAPSGFKDYANAKEWATQAFKNINTALSDGLTSAIKGETSWYNFAKNFGLMFTNTIVEGFSKGLAQQLLAPVQNIMGDMLKGVFNLGGMSGDAATFPVEKLVKSAFGNQKVVDTASESTEVVADAMKENLADMPGWFDNLWSTIKGGFGSLMSGLGSVLSSIGGGISSGWGWLTSLFSTTAVAAATGGYVSGPGTGTSDSIPAMLSNGEFVVNAKQATKFAPLLAAINSGNFLGLADGGAVATSQSSGNVPMFGAANSPNISEANSNAVTSDSNAAVLNAISELGSAIAGSTTQIMSSINSLNTTVITGFSAISMSMLAMSFQNLASNMALQTALAGLQISIPATIGSIVSSAVLTLSMELLDSTLIILEAIALASAGGFATGGWVSGPGTGTSDSIPAKLSNGEFVVNAKQASKFGSLLQAINDNKISGFAMGGFVGGGTFAESSVASTSNKANRNNNAQVFNINITGDISRQTRQEVLRMIPQIATGVNQNNYETGYVSRR
ncbi:tape measure protein [Flavobacterium sp.]|jgi:tape measure domain-containing protein|uniref:tape measure protein n=1 Tax=Flavobacterium sp. TaxID=239 RepID=UPI0037C17D55